MKSRDAYVEQLKLSIDKLNADMAQLEVRAKKVKKDTREKYDEQLAKMQAQSKLAVAKLDEMQAAGVDTWEGLVAESEKVRDAFVHSFHYFKSQV